MKSSPYKLSQLLLCFLMVLAGPFANAQEQNHYTCYRASGKINADGLLNEPDWLVAEWSNDFVDITGKRDRTPVLQTRIKLLWDDDYLYVAAELHEPGIWGTITERDEVIFHDNDFEIFLDPDGNGQNYLEIEVNALGTVWDLLLTKAYKDHGKPVSTWDLKGLKTGIRVLGSLNDPSSPDTSWIVEMALPLQELMHGKGPQSKPSEGVQWRVNFSRVEWETEVSGSSYCKKTDPKTGMVLPEHNWVWSSMGEVSMHIPERWGRLEFSSEPVRPEPFAWKDDREKIEFQVWCWMGGHDSWTGKQWDSVLSLLADVGIHGILTQAGPVTLKRMIPIAQKYGIVVEKWFIAMMDNDTALIRQHPDWFVVSREGRSCITDPAYVGYYRFLCPSNPDVRSYLEESIGEYLDIPGLAAIHLDYIRYPDVILPRALWDKYGIVQDKEYPPYDYCYCARCRAKFKAESGIDPLILDSPDTSQAWRQFRFNQVTAVVKQLSDACHRSGRKISAAVFPGPSLSKALVRQEWDKWPLDEVFPMLYQGFYNESFDWIRRETSEGVTSLHDSAPLYSGLYIPSLNPRELHTAIAKSMEGGAHGICLFSYEAMTSMHWQIIGSFGLR